MKDLIQELRNCEEEHLWKVLAEHHVYDVNTRIFQSIERLRLVEPGFESVLFIKDGKISSREAEKFGALQYSSYLNSTIQPLGRRHGSNGCAFVDCSLPVLWVPEDFIDYSLFVRCRMRSSFIGRPGLNGFNWFHECDWNSPEFIDPSKEDKEVYSVNLEDVSFDLNIITSGDVLPDEAQSGFAGHNLDQFEIGPLWMLAAQWATRSGVTVSGVTECSIDPLVELLYEKGNRTGMLLRSISDSDGAWESSDGSVYFRRGRAAGVLLRCGESSKFWFGHPYLLKALNEAGIDPSSRSLPLWKW